MRKKLFLVIGIVCLLSFEAAGQSGSQLQRVADLIGVAEIKTIQYSGNGTLLSLGQSATPIAPWPRYYGKTFSRAIDFNTSSMRDDYVRLQGENPPAAVHAVYSTERRLFAGAARLDIVSKMNFFI
jgi:hypothetical protein